MNVIFMCSEVYDSSDYDCSIDMYSAGVLMFVMLSGTMAYENKLMNANFVTKKKPHFSCMAHELRFNRGIWQGISHNAKFIIKNLLSLDSKTRYSAESGENLVLLFICMS